MSTINSKTLRAIEDLFKMSAGYVLNFSNAKFQKFVDESIGIDIYKDLGYEDNISKANKLRQIIKNEDNYKVAKLINDLIEYFEDLISKSNQFVTEYERKKIIEIREAIQNNGSEESLNLKENLKEKMQLISTRNAKFSEMQSGEKIKEIANLIENLLKTKGKYINIDYNRISLGFISEDIVLIYRKKIQCFRHSSEDSLAERNSYTKENKKFLIDFGIIICNLINNELQA